MCSHLTKMQYKIYRSNEIETGVKCLRCGMTLNNKIIKTIPILFEE